MGKARILASGADWRVSLQRDGRFRLEMQISAEVDDEGQSYSAGLVQTGLYPHELCLHIIRNARSDAETLELIGGLRAADAWTLHAVQLQAEAKARNAAARRLARASRTGAELEAALAELRHLGGEL